MIQGSRNSVPPCLQYNVAAALSGIRAWRFGIDVPSTEEVTHPMTSVLHTLTLCAEGYFWRGCLEYDFLTDAVDVPAQLWPGAVRSRLHDGRIKTYTPRQMSVLSRSANLEQAAAHDTCSTFWYVANSRGRISLESAENVRVTGCRVRQHAFEKCLGIVAICTVRSLLE